MVEGDDDRRAAHDDAIHDQAAEVSGHDADARPPNCQLACPLELWLSRRLLAHGPLPGWAHALLLHIASVPLQSVITQLSALQAFLADLESQSCTQLLTVLQYTGSLAVSSRFELVLRCNLRALCPLQQVCFAQQVASADCCHNTARLVLLGFGYNVQTLSSSMCAADIMGPMNGGVL